MADGDGDDLRLNELRRFRKTSGRLALEAYSHCEVPAGCGGVVMRWRQAGAPIGIAASTYVAGLADGPWLDGQALVEQRTQVAPGAHVLSFTGKPSTGDSGFVLARLRLEPTIATALAPTTGSRGDGRWRASLAPPGEGWQLPGFDDSGFVALIEMPVPKPAGNDQWRWKSLTNAATGLGLPPSAGQLGAGRLSKVVRRRAPRVWVRWAFWVGDEGFA